MQTINIKSYLSDKKTSPYQIFIICMMFFTVIFDGMDVAIMGFIVPSLKSEWGINNLQAANILSAALAGLIVGALISGPLADKFGRKKVIVISVFVFGIFTLLCATAGSGKQLIIYRLISGMALGGVMPQCATLVTEFSAEKHRSKFVAIVFAGFTVGAAAGGFLSAKLIPLWGWESVMVAVGILPVLLSIILLVFLPESISFLVVKKADRRKIVKIINRMHPNSVSLQDEFVLPQKKVIDGRPIRTVLNKYYRLGSFTLWGSYFFGLLLVYLLGSWMPTIIEEAGFSIAKAAIIGAVFQLGGPLGSITWGFCMDRWEPNKVLMFAFSLGAVMMVCMSFIGYHFILLIIVVFLVGFGLNGGNTGLNALSSLFFPTSVRSTGNSWMHGIGRFGAVASTYIGAIMLDLHWGLHEITLALCIPAACLIMLLFVKYHYYKEKG